MSVRKPLLVVVGMLVLLGVAVEVYAGARTDLDWMIVCNKFQLGQGRSDVTTWEFSPHWTMNWWDAYILTVVRLVVSSFLLGVVAAALVFMFYYEHSKGLCSYVYKCICALCAYVRSRDARSKSPFLAVKGCLNVGKSSFYFSFRHGESPWFSVSPILTVGTEDVAVLDFDVVDGVDLIG
jgi:hypothetical protein